MEVYKKPLVQILSEQLGKRVVGRNDKYVYFGSFEEVPQSSVDTALAKQQELYNNEVINNTRKEAKAVKDKELQANTYALSDGSVYQVRPQDIPNFQLAIARGKDTDWILADNSIRTTTVDELKEILDAGIAQSKAIYDTYIDKLKSIGA